jgi:hypothetical protein
VKVVSVTLSSLFQTPEGNHSQFAFFTFDNFFVSLTHGFVGSPIFIMKLTGQARYLEVQLLADQYGDAISLFGRDCSVNVDSSTNHRRSASHDCEGQNFREDGTGSCPTS